MVLHLPNLFKTLGASGLVNNAALSLDLEGDGGSGLAHIVEHSAGVDSRVFLINVGDIKGNITEVECRVEAGSRLEDLAVMVPLDSHAGVVDRFYSALHMGMLVLSEVGDALKYKTILHVSKTLDFNTKETVDSILRKECWNERKKYS